MLCHPFDPVFDAHSRILILGSFPSVRSREEGFYYGHPRNRFWKLLADWTGENLPETVQARREFCLRYGLALWDVMEQCEIEGSADATIRQVQVNDLSRILSAAPIERILVNGKTAAAYLFRAYPNPEVPVEVLPSTSPANAAWNLEKLKSAWFVALGSPEL